MLTGFVDEFNRYRLIGERALAQIPDSALDLVSAPDGNSAGMLVCHLSGNLTSRFSDFLTSDGEKPSRDRDNEFEDRSYSREEITAMWTTGWNTLENALGELTDNDLVRLVTIRQQSLTVHAALCRSLAHVSYHVGQLVLIARQRANASWQWISIPKGESQSYNTALPPTGLWRATKGLMLVLFVAASISQASLAQTPAPSVKLSFGVDTSIVEVRDIVRLMRAYLAQPDTSARTRGLWSKASAFDVQYGDPAFEAYQGFPATILGVTGTGPGDSVFIVKVIHAWADSSRKQINPLALQRLFVIRAPGSEFGWQLSSPLPRITRNWPRSDVGRMTFHYGPGQSYSPKKALQAARFVDSVARLFRVPPPKHLDAYLTGTLDESQRLVGLDFSGENSGPGTGFGGRGGGTGILLFGNTALGEAYLHEIVHAVLGPALKSRNPIFNEGVAVWLGGSGGKSLKETYALLYDYQRKYPDVSLSGLFGDDPPGGYAAVTAFYATRGLIIDAIYRHSGIGGVRRFAQLSGSPDDIVKLLPQYLPRMDGDIDLWWRTETARTLLYNRKY